MTTTAVEGMDDPGWAISSDMADVVGIRMRRIPQPGDRNAGHTGVAVAPARRLAPFCPGAIAAAFSHRRRLVANPMGHASSPLDAVLRMDRAARVRNAASLRPQGCHASWAEAGETSCVAYASTPNRRSRCCWRLHAHACAGSHRLQRWSPPFNLRRANPTSGKNAIGGLRHPTADPLTGAHASRTRCGSSGYGTNDRVGSE